MNKSATDIMQEILHSTLIDAIAAMKAASRGMPNTLLRDLNAVHPNSTFADLPVEVQSAINSSVRAAFTRLLKEGYSVSPRGSEPVRDTRSSPRPGSGPGRPPHVRGGRPPRGANPGGGGPRNDGDRRPPRGGRPGRGPKPGGK